MPESGKGERAMVEKEKITEATNEIDDEIQREAASRIIQCFLDADFPVKVKRISRSKPNDRFRVFCFAQKNKESVVINTDMWGFKGMVVQMRIFNNDSFKKLDELTENIRKQILYSRDCGFCWTQCAGKQYYFSYNGIEYIKCQNFGCNFKFKIADENDIASIIALVKREIDGETARE